MQEVTFKHRGIEMQFTLHYGVICGHHTLVTESTKISGGGGKIYTSFIDDRVYGKIKSIKSKTERNFITEFTIAGENDRDVHVRLLNNNRFFRDGQKVTAWIDNHTGMIYKIHNHNNQEVTVINPLTDIFRRGRRYFRSYLRANPITKWLWYILLAAAASWAAFAIWNLIDNGIDVLSVIIVAVFGILPAFAVFAVTEWFIRAAMARGINREIRKAISRQ